MLSHSRYKVSTCVYLPGAATRRWFRRLPGLPSFALQSATLLLLTAMLWSTLPGFLDVGPMLARRGGSVLGGSCTAFLVSLSCGSRVAELAAATVSATQGAFVRPCIVRCPLPMIISSLSSLRAGVLRAVLRVQPPGGQAVLISFFCSCFCLRAMVIISFHHHCSLALLVAP